MKTQYSYQLSGLSFVLACTFFSISSWAADLYVSTSGSDSNAGSSSAPFRTIQKAANVANAGTIIHVAPGTYAESIEMTRGGSSSAPIRFVSDSKWQAKVTGASGSSGSTFMIRSDYVEIQNFDISSQSGYQGIELFGSYGKALGNHVHNVRAGACANGAGGAGIAVSLSPPWSNPYSASSIGTGNVVSGNLVHDIGDPNLGCALIHGIYVMNYKSTVTNNIVYRTMGWGITSWHYARQNIFTNNTVFNNNVGGLNTGASDDGSVDDSTTVSNNLIFYNGMPSGGFVTSSVSGPRYGITQEGNYGPNNRFLNNIVFGNKPSDYSSNVSQSGGRTIDPAQGSIFVNWKMDGSGDYHLSSGSSAADLGTTACAPNVSGCAPATDYDGVSRPQGSGYDVGAYELSLSSPSPAPAPSVKVSATQVSPGQLITVSVMGTGTNSAEYVALYLASNADSAFSYQGQWMYLNGTQTQPASPIASASLQFKAPMETGIYNIRLFGGTDASSRLAVSSDISVVVAPAADTAAPTTSIASPSNGSTVKRGSTVQISASASDNVGVVKVEFYVNGALKCTDTTSNYTCSFTASTLRGVQYNIQTKAYDAAGNVGASPIVSIKTRRY